MIIFVRTPHSTLLYINQRSCLWTKIRKNYHDCVPSSTMYLFQQEKIKGCTRNIEKKYTSYIYWSRCGQLAPAGGVKNQILKELAAYQWSWNNYSLVPLRWRRRRRKTTSTNLICPWLITIGLIQNKLQGCFWVTNSRPLDLETPSPSPFETYVLFWTLPKRIVWLRYFAKYLVFLVRRFSRNSCDPWPLRCQPSCR